MCGRFVFPGQETIFDRAYPGFRPPEEEYFQPSFNVAPTQSVLAVTNELVPQSETLRWGLIPSWTKELGKGYQPINARGETLAEKPMFKGLFAKQRCLIFAQGFYEWKSIPGQKAKKPYYIYLKSEEPFTFAGLWTQWQAQDGEAIRSCTIITTEPNELLAPVHDRMPVILAKEHHDIWLNSNGAKGTDLQPLIAPYPAQEMAYYPISKDVGKPANNYVELLAPIGDVVVG